MSYSFPALLMHTGPRLHVNKQEYILFLARYVLSSPSISAAGKVVKEDSRTSTSLSAINDDNDLANANMFN